MLNGQKLKQIFKNSFNTVMYALWILYKPTFVHFITTFFAALQVNNYKLNVSQRVLLSVHFDKDALGGDSSGGGTWSRWVYKGCPKLPTDTAMLASVNFVETIEWNINTDASSRQDESESVAYDQTNIANTSCQSF